MSNLGICQINSESCGTYTSKPNSKSVVLKDLNDDFGAEFGADVAITECDVICMRSELSLDLDGFICPKHRWTLGKYYRPPKKCQYSEHPINSNSKGVKLPWQLYCFIKSRDSSFVLGDVVCTPCQKKLSIMKKEASEADYDDDVVTDPHFEPEDLIVDETERRSRKTKLDSLSDIFEIERIRYQVNTKIENMASVSLDYFRGVYAQLQNKLTDTFCRLVAPGQEEQMKSILETTEADSTVAHLKEAFDSCTTRRARMSVLMLVPKTYSKSKVCELFDCSLYEMKKARSILKLDTVCGVEKKEQVYSRLSIEKAQHFINFLFSTGLLQEVAYGTTKLKLESGDRVTVGNTILNGIYQHAIKEYLIYSKEITYKPLGTSTLRNILEKMKPHMRKKLAGVDAFLVEGIEAFEALKSCVKLFGNNAESKELLKCINNSEIYLKCRFKMHCKYEDSCSSHCIKHGLSNPNDLQLYSECKQSHDLICEECVALVDCIASLRLKLLKLPDGHEKDVAMYEVENAETKIIEWQKHIMRGVQQSKARTDAFANLGSTDALWIRDFSQKYNPTKTLESMNEYFGKRGMSVSVEVFISKSFMSFQKDVYLVALDRCDQGSLETLCIGDTVLEQFTKDNPHIKQIQLKTDNAGNYHANGVPECMFQLAQKRGILLSAYNYNEAQLGKDQCDRESAIFKSCAENWLRQKETHKITTAKELLEAVFSNGGPKNTKMCVLKIDTTRAEFGGIRNIKNISKYHSVQFEETGAIYKEYYEIGEGKFHEYNDIKFVNGSSLIVEWTSSVRNQQPMIYESRRKKDYFECPEILCILEFKTENEMMNHLASGSHQFAKTKNAMDKVVLYYAHQKHIQNVSCEEGMSSRTNILGESERIKYSQIYGRGWARKIRKVKKMSERQKDFIRKLFENGETSKIKLSAEQMAQRMKDEIIDGKYYFSPHEYLETSQIRGLISRLKNEKNSQPTPKKMVAMTEDDGIECHLEDICDSLFVTDEESVH